MMPATAIQTVDERGEVLAEMLAAITWPHKVYVDAERRGCLWNMERIMRDNADTGVLILQDDLVIPPYFEAEFLKAWMPEQVMTFFIGMADWPRGLWEKGYTYAAVKNIWGQANWYPPAVVKRYLDWSSRAAPPLPPGAKPVKGVRNATGDDTSITMFLRSTRTFSIMTLPHLVDHKEVKSTMGHPATIRGIKRVSMLFGEQYLRPWDKTRVAKGPR